ncbi:extracellular solute-binding protein [Bifidobacterium anseris]|nr:extracellular solute-binding protein [Bifidobacterium anseris]
MMINWKKAIGLTAAVAMLVPMAACGGNDSNANGNASASNSNEKQTATLTVWAPSEDADWMKAMQEAFEKAHTNYDITWKNATVSEGDAAKTVQTDPSAAADVYMFANDQLGTLIKLNAIGEVSDEVAKQVQDQNSETMVQSVTGADGKIYGVPYTSNTYFMYYNKDKFSADDVKNLNTMLEKGKVSYPLTNSWYIPAFYLGAGMQMFGDNGQDGAAGIDFGSNADAVTKYLVDMVANPNFVLDDGTNGVSNLVDGTTDAMFSGSWSAADVKKGLGDKYGAVAMPSFTADGKDYQMKSFAGSKAVAFNPNTKAPQVASEFAAYLGSADAQKKHWEMREIVPSDKSLTDLEGMKDAPYVQAQVDTIDKTSVLQPTIAAMNGWWTPAENFGKAIYNKDVTADNYKEQTQTWMDTENKEVKAQATEE